MKKHARITILFLLSCLIILAVFTPMCCSYILPWERRTITQRAQDGDINAFYHLYNYRKNWLADDNDAMVSFLGKYISQYSRYCNELNERLMLYSMPDKQQILEQYKIHCVKNKNEIGSMETPNPPKTIDW
jgi:hypothetical protein